MVRIRTQQILAIFILIMILGSVTSVQCEKPKKQRLTIIGTVIAFDLMPVSSMRRLNPNFLPHTYDFIFRIDKSIKGKEQAKYILVRYEYRTETSNLPKEIFNGRGKWQLKLIRNNECDRLPPTDIPLVRNGKEISKLPALRRALGHEDEQIPNVILPCYVLRQKGFKLLNED